MSADICGVAPFRKFDDIENGKQYFKITSSMRDIYLARLAETNLIAAEAYIKLNKPEEAVSYINIVRNRAKATPAVASEMNIDYILNDRFNLTQVQLTYNMPKEVLRGSFVKGLSFFVNANNLLTIAKERKALELNVGSTPQTRFYQLGLKGTF